MEAVPRLPMLSFDLKVSPERTTFGQKLKQYIRDFYHEDPEMYSNEIHALEGLRASAVCAVRDVTGCSTLKRYYCQLHFLQSRFPMHRDGAAAVSFTWRDTYASMVCTLSDIRFEMVAILYNIGALHSQLGASDSRTTSDGMKMSCTHFQCAAWAFQHLKDSFPQPAGVDLAPDVMQFMYHLSLAQAQECILEKSMMDNRKATIIAKVAAQIVDYYNLALNTLEQGGSDDCSVSETVGSKIYKTWKRYVKFKTAYHSCVALLYQGQQAEEQQKMGERVAYYQAASEKLEEASKLAKGMDYADVISEALTFTADVVEGKKKAAKNENEFIYHEEVPERDALTDIKGASLVKGIAFNVNDPEISGPDIFARLVPMKAHEASSLYSEEKAKLLRRVGAQIDEKDEELVSFMTSLQLEHLNIHGESSRLPQELIDRCAALSVKPNAIQNLIDSMNKLSDTYHDVEAMLQEIKELLQEEEMQEKKYQEVVGKRPPSIVATDLTREAGKYQEAHGKASESNQTLHKAMMLHVSNLRVLAQPLAELQKSVPEVSPPSTSDDQEAVEKLRQLVAKVEEMRRQRAMLSAQLRESICQDDITRQLVTRASEPLDTIFNQELQKHQRYVSLVEQNLAAQDNILRALTDAYARYGSTRKATNEAVRKREATISALIASYDAYEDLLAKSSKGLEFYRKLEVNVSKLLQRVRSACKVQEEEREQVLAKALPAASKAAVAAAAVPGSASPVAGSSSGVAIGTGESMSVDSSSTSSGGPKLRDYLQSMKRGSSVTAAAAAAVGGYGAGTQPVATVADMPMYYPADYVHPVAGITTGTVPSTSNAVSSSSGQSPYYDQVSTVTSSHSQWALPPVRPAPVGSEGPDVSQTEPSAKAPPTVPAISDTDKSSAVTGSSQYPYQPDVSARITSGGYPPGYLAGAAYGNASGAYPTPPQPQYKPVVPTYQQYGSYMPPTSAAYDTGATVSSAATNPAYMYTGTYQNQATSVAQSLPQTSYAPTGAAASAAYPTGTYQATNMNLSIQSGEVPSLSGYPSQLQQPQQPQQSQHPSQNSPSRYIPASAYSAYPYVAAASASYYTNAGSYPTSQTCSSQTGIEGQTFAAQYNTTYAVPSGYPTSNAYSPSAYYTLPYGYQSLDSPAAQVAPAPVDPQNMTYMQACGGKQTTTTTYMYPNASGQSTASSEPTTATSSVNSVPTPTAVTTTAPTFSKSSNVDLLAGLDFSLNQAPLTPQQLPVSKVSESAISNAASAPTPVSVITTSTTTSVSVSTPAPIVAPNVPLSADTVPVIEPGVIKSPVGPTKTGAMSGDADHLVENEGQEGCRGAECRLSKVSGKDPYSDPELLNQFVQDVEKFEKFVEGLTSKTLNGPTPLDIKWKELLDLQEKDAHKRSISVARCYPMKNRFPDILPYDNSRVELPSTKDDYINASFVKDVTPLTPPFILTQAPLPSTISDFWTMVMEQQVEVVVCLLSDAELSGQVYWPVDKSQEMVSGRLRLTLQSCNTRAHWVERILSITCGDTRVTRVIVHLQFTGWPGSSFPSSPGPFLALVLEVLSLHRQQRVGWHPLVVHCLSGVGRSGLLCVLAAALLEVQAGRGLADLVIVAAAASSHRKNCLRDRQHLQFAYQALLYHAQDLLMKRGILTSRSSFEDKRNRGTKCHTRHPSEDFLLGAPADLSQLQSGLDRMGLDSKSQNSSEEVEPEPQPPGSSSVEKPTNASDPLSKLDPLWSLRQS
ncbi:Tyrosine-protein phosphatase non-receptor type 61F [Gryllus bimaculatus]|nr:Tyrosine-protein phosphatase non-receptor type 61F [Gryllus bimaculatus]